MDNSFPLYVQLDDGELIRIESMDKILVELEAIDIENDEYLFWNADGKPVKVVLTGKVGRFRNPTVSGVRHVENPMSFQSAAQEWANQLGVRVDLTGTPQQVWDKLQEAQAKLTPRRGLLSRLFRGGRLTHSQLPPAVSQTISEAVTWCSYKQLRSPELNPSAILDVPNWAPDSEPGEAWVERKRASYRQAISWLNETRSELLKSANLKTFPVVDALSRSKLLIYESLETVDDGAAEAASMGFYDVHDAPPWDTWVLYADDALFCCVPDFAVARAQKGIDANPVDCIHWADWSRLARIKN